VLMDGQQLYGGDAEAAKMGDRGGGGKPCVGGPKLPRHAGMAPRGALHVKLVDDRPVARDLRAGVAPPAQSAAPHHTRPPARRILGRSQCDAWVRLLAVPTVAEYRLPPIQLARDRAGVRVKQELGWVEPQALGRLVRSVRAIAVKDSRPDPRHVAVPNVMELLG